MVVEQLPKYKQLENQFASYIGTKYCSACSSGTSALTLAVAALDIGIGDEVIVPEFTMIASAWAVSYNGATPVFVDCGDDFNIDVSLLEKAITKKTRAIMVTHIYGRPCDMESIGEIAGKYDLPIIEDACEAHGAHINGKMIGSFGALGCLSLYRNKIIQSEEGGLITTDVKEYKDKIDDLKSMAFGKSHDYYHEQIGWNFRITNMQADCAIGELSDIDNRIQARAIVAETYDKYLGEFTTSRPKGSVVWVYDILLTDKVTRDYVYFELLQNDVDARVFFKPMSMQPMYHGEYTNLKAFDFSQRGLYLPVSHKMGKPMVEKIGRLTQQLVYEKTR